MNKKMKLNILFLALALILVGLLSACGGSADEITVEELPDEILAIKPPPSNKQPVPDNQESSQYHVLMLGNSHTSSVKGSLTTLLEQSSSNVKVEALFGTFLDTILFKESNIETLTDNPWTHVILQGQKYSESGATLYSTAAAKQWIYQAKTQQSMPILFPEHPQKGNKFEGEYVHSIHVGIANEEPSCVAPVGLAWDLALAINGELDLYAVDDNHASDLGALFSALIIYEVITGQSADLLPYIPALPGGEDTQDFLGQMASQAITENTPCIF